MKIFRSLLICLLCALFLGTSFPLAHASTTTYYVSNTGSDSNNGTDPSTPWQTINKVNTSTFQPGDQILFKRGDTWREQLTVPSSGSAANPITFGAYGSGNLPVISGADVVTGSWTGYTSTGTVTPSIANNADDNIITAYTSSFSAGGGEVFFGHAGAGNNSVDGDFRFQLNVPRGATITSASFSGTISSSYTGVSRVLISAQAADNSAQFMSFLDWSAAHTSTTTASVSWSTTNPTLGNTATSPSLTPIVQEIVNRSGWVSGNYIHLFMDDNNSDNFTYLRLWAHEHASNFAALSVGYSYSPASVYQIALASQPDTIMVNGTLGTQKGSVNALSADNDWYWAGNVLYLYSSTDPTTKKVEHSVRSYGIDTNSKNYLVIQNLSLTGTIEWGAGIAIQTSTNVTVDSCQLFNNFYAGIKGFGTNYGRLTLSNNLIYGNGAPGITLWDGFSGYSEIGHDLVTYNTVRDNGWRDVETYGVAGPFSNSTVSHNTIYNNGLGGASHSIYNHGIYVINGTGTNIVVDSNVVYGQPNGSGIKLTGSGIVENNLTYNNTSAGIQIGTNGNNSITATVENNVSYGNGYGIAQLDKQAGDIHLNIFNNTLYNNINSNAGRVSFTREIMIGDPITSLVVKNNILSGTGDKEIAVEPQTNMVWDYNIVHHASIYFNSSVLSWSQWQNLGFDTHGFNTNPLLTSPTTGIFTLQQGSPATNSGLSLGSPYNLGLNPTSSWPSSVSTLDQSQNGTGYEIGAYVFPEALPVTTPTPPTTYIAPMSSTRHSIANLLAPGTTTVTPAVPMTPVSVSFTHTLHYGMNTTEVKLLQDTLKQLGFFPQSTVSNGNFGPTTKASLQKLQCAYQIVCSGDEASTGYGQLGPRTREGIASANSL